MNNIQLLNQYIKNSLHYGHKIKDWNPKMAPYILCEKNGHHIINLFKTSKLLLLAGNILKQSVQNKKTILFVGTNKIFSNIIKFQAEKAKVFFINHKWAGGTLTNWEIIKKSIKKLNTLENLQINNNLSKKEINKNNKIINKLKYLFDGIRLMTNLPDIVIFIDQKKDLSAIKECIKLGITTICIVDTNCDPSIVSYPIPANDDSITSVNYILNYLSEQISK
jgi:small subunit ribosomal protein S2